MRPEVTDDARALAEHIAKLPVSDKDRLLTLVAEDQAARARMELLRGLRGDSDSTEKRSSRPRRTVAQLLDTAAASRLPREERAAAMAAAQHALPATGRVLPPGIESESVHRLPVAAALDPPRRFTVGSPCGTHRASHWTTCPQNLWCPIMFTTIANTP